MKELLNYLKEDPKQALKDFGAVVCIFVVWFALLWLCAILQGCSVARNTTIDGKATIITVDTTYIKHNGVLKYPKH